MIQFSFKFFHFILKRIRNLLIDAMESDTSDEETEEIDIYSDSDSNSSGSKTPKKLTNTPKKRKIVRRNYQFNEKWLLEYLG